MLVKLAFAMQRLKISKKYPKKICHDQQRWGGGTIFGFYGGDTAVMRGDIELMGGSPSPPSLGKTLHRGIDTIAILNI